MDNLQYLKQQLQLGQGGGIYFDGGRILPEQDSAILFVGLGGTGADALLRIKNQVRSRMKLPKTDDGFWAADVPQNIAFLELDTDATVQNRSYGCARFDESGSDYASLSVADMNAVIREAREGNIPYTEWLDREVTPVQGAEGAGGIRQMGRLMLFWNISGVLTKLNAALDKLFLGVVPAPKKFYVFLVAGIAGGTGSGTFLDMAYILQRAVELKHYVTPKMLGYLVLSDLYNQGDPNMLKANCFAALKELDYWMSVREHEDAFQQRYTGDFNLNIAKNPFDYCHLITSKDMAGNTYTYSSAMDVIAQNIFAYIAEDGNHDAQGNSTFDSMYSNITRQIVTSTARAPIPGNYGYLSVGAAMVRIPYMEISTLFGARMFQLLRPCIERRPTQQQCDKVERDCGSGEQALLDKVSEKNAPYPNLSKCKYKDIWNPQEDRAWGMVYRWLAECQTNMARIAGNMAAEVEGKLRTVFQEAIKDVKRGPCWVSGLLDSNINFSLVHTLETQKARYNALESQCSSDSAKAKRDLDQTKFDGGAGKNKGQYTEEYLKHLKEYADNNIAAHQYEYLAKTASRLIDRLKIYQERIFKPLKDSLAALGEVFDSNFQKLQAEHIHGTTDPALLVRPLEFEDKNKQQMEAAYRTAATDFFADLAANLKRWVGRDWVTLADNSAGRTDISGEISRYVEGKFKQLTDETVEKLLNDQLAPGEQLSNAVMRIYQRLQGQASPMFSKTGLYTAEGAQSFSFVSVPNNCPNVLAVSLDRNTGTGVLPTVAGNQANLKVSAEQDKIYWVTVLSCLPLYAFADLQEMEIRYEGMMGDRASRAGMHLIAGWRDTMASPLMEPAWTTTYRCEATKRRNEKVREAFRLCLREDILSFDMQHNQMVLKQAKTAPNFEALYGSPAERMRRINQQRDQVWNAGTELKLDALGQYKKPANGFDEVTLAENVEENTLRFYSKCEALLKQADILQTVLDKRQRLEAIRDYLRAYARGLIKTVGLTTKLFRSKLDAMPIQLFDATTDNREYADYQMSVRFLEVYPELKQELQERYSEEFIPDLLQSPEQMQHAQNLLLTLSGSCDEERSKATAAVKDLSKASPAYAQMQDTVAFYQDLRDWCADELQLLRSSDRTSGTGGVKAPVETAAAWTCPKCGKTGIDPDSNFCPKCGTPRQDENSPWTCPKCGKTVIDPDSNFCPKCGTPRPKKIDGPWTCPSCGKADIDPDFGFCPNCGTKKN